MTAPDVADQFPTPGLTYLDTASYGLPPIATADALRRAVDAWSAGTARWYTDWDPLGGECASLMASLIRADPASVALVPAVSVGVGTVASAFGAGDEVLVVEDDYNSVLLPLLAAERERGLHVRRVALEDLLGAITETAALVAVSHVRSNDGRIIDLAELSRVTRAAAVPVLVDLTHSAGVMDVDLAALGFEFAVCAAYKHLLCPRGASFLVVTEEWRDRVVPRNASWRGQADPYGVSSGGTLGVLASTAARFNVSLDWFAWVGARESLTFLSGIPSSAREAHCVGLATELATSLGVTPTGSSIVTVPHARTPDDALAWLDRSSVRVLVREDDIRLSFHLYNTREHVARAAEVLAALREPG